MTPPRNDRFTLVEALDRLIDKGVSVSGDLSISVAEVDLVYLGLRVLLSSAEDVPALSGMRASSEARPAVASAPAAPMLAAQGSETPDRFLEPGEAADQRRGDDCSVGEPAPALTPPPAAPQRLLDIDPADIERDLTRLVLTIVELLRQLMEKQALRRMEGGSLREEEIERLGIAFARLDEKMDELRTVFGLSEDDLNIDLGPLGTLV